VSMNFQISVNGKDYSVNCEEKTPLLWVLRNYLNLIGTRFGCGSGLCGACTVLLNGVPIHSCDTPIWSVGDKEIETVESEENPTLNKLKSCVADLQAAQCGFCISGLLMRATSLIENDQKLDRDSIAHGLDGHLCRCGAHNRIIDAVAQAGQQ
jgi:nicotinate dehydrogenase subunit A